MSCQAARTWANISVYSLYLSRHSTLQFIYRLRLYIIEPSKALSRVKQILWPCSQLVTMMACLKNKTSFQSAKYILRWILWIMFPVAQPTPSVCADIYGSGLSTKLRSRLLDIALLVKFFFVCLLTRTINTQTKRKSPISSHRDRTSLVIKGLLYGIKNTKAWCGTQRGIPSAEDNTILPVCVANHSAGFVDLACSRN